MILFSIIEYNGRIHKRCAGESSMALPAEEVSGFSVPAFASRASARQAVFFSAA